jgi:uncharacterized cupin superfamily protein
MSETDNRRPLRQVDQPAIDPTQVPLMAVVSDYPKEFLAGMLGTERRQLGVAFGLKNFGVNLVRLPPGCASAQRHWHTRQDEFIYVLSGELTLITDAGPQVLTAGHAAGFPAGKPDGHQLVNRSDHDAVYLEIGDRSPGDDCEYPDVDLKWRNTDGDQRGMYLHKDGTPY